jgi:hypothetical protein
MKQTINQSKREEQGLAFKELKHDNRAGGDKLKIDAIIIIVGARRLNESCKNSSLVV